MIYISVNKRHYLQTINIITNNNNINNGDYEHIKSILSIERHEYFRILDCLSVDQ